MENTTRLDGNTNSSSLRAPESSFEVARESLLDGFAQLSDSPESLDVRQLQVRDRIIVCTHNTEYRLVILDPAELRVSVQGGDFFMEPTEAFLSGTSTGGALLKVGWIVLGFQLEFRWHRAPAQFPPQTVITSSVTSFFVEREAQPKPTR